MSSPRLMQTLSAWLCWYQNGFLGVTVGVFGVGQTRVRSDHWEAPRPKISRNNTACHISAGLSAPKARSREPNQSVDRRTGLTAPFHERSGNTLRSLVVAGNEDELGRASAV